MGRSLQLARSLLVAAVALAVAPPAVGAWQCEGRPCGISLWACCCEAPETADAHCAAQTVPSAGACASGCGCELTVRAVDPQARSEAAAPALAKLPGQLPVPAVQAPAPRTGLVAWIEARGPPPRPGTPLARPARAPPTSTPVPLS